MGMMSFPPSYHRDRLTPAQEQEAEMETRATELQDDINRDALLEALKREAQAVAERYCFRPLHEGLYMVDVVLTTEPIEP